MIFKPKLVISSLYVCVENSLNLSCCFTNTPVRHEKLFEINALRPSLGTFTFMPTRMASQNIVFLPEI